MFLKSPLDPEAHPKPLKRYSLLVNEIHPSVSINNNALSLHIFCLCILFILA